MINLKLVDESSFQAVLDLNACYTLMVNKA